MVGKYVCEGGDAMAVRHGATSGEEGKEKEKPKLAGTGEGTTLGGRLGGLGGLVGRGDTGGAG